MIDPQMVRQSWARLDAPLSPSSPRQLVGSLVPMEVESRCPPEIHLLCSLDQWILECGPKASSINISRKWPEMHIPGSLNPSLPLHQKP